MLIFKGEQRKLLTEGSGSTPATPELDSAMGVWSWIDPSKEVFDETAYRQLKELVDERYHLEARKIGVSLISSLE